MRLLSSVLFLFVLMVSAKAALFNWNDDITCNEKSAKDASMTMSHQLHRQSETAGELKTEGFQTSDTYPVRIEDKKMEMRIYLSSDYKPKKGQTATYHNGDLLFRMTHTQPKKKMPVTFIFEKMKPAFDPQLKDIECENRF